MQIKDIIQSHEVYCISTGKTVQEAAELMSEKGIGALPVLDGDKLVGILTERDLLRRIIAKKKSPEKVNIEEIMTRELILAPPDMDLKECASLMRRYNIRHLPVADGDNLVGIISQRDLLKIEIDDKEYEIQRLHEYIHYIPPYSVTEKVK
jgi:CBS domain-containing protein